MVKTVAFCLGDDVIPQWESKHNGYVNPDSWMNIKYGYDSYGHGTHVLEKCKPHEIIQARWPKTPTSGGPVARQGDASFHVGHGSKPWQKPDSLVENIIL